MGIETRYDHIYYVVLNEEWIAAIRRGLEASPSGFSWELVCKCIDSQLEKSKDWTVNNFRVEYSQYCDDIDSWIRSQLRHKDCPVFVQFDPDCQPIIKTGSGSLFVLYEPDGVTYSENEEGPDYGNGLWAYDGRL